MIIAITGYKSSGKDTVAKMIQFYFYSKVENKLKGYPNLLLEDWLKNKLLYENECEVTGYTIKKFASKLKQICALAVNCRVEDFESEEFKNTAMPATYQFADYGQHTYRWLLQHFADKMKEVLGKDYFINELFSQYKDKNEFTKLGGAAEYPNWIISDLRFTKTSPEEEKIREFGGKIIRIDRFDSNTDTHSSETEVALIKPDAVILNDGTIEELYNAVCVVLKEFGL